MTGAAHVPIHDPRCALVDGGCRAGSWVVDRTQKSRFVGRHSKGAGIDSSQTEILDSRDEQELVSQTSSPDDN
jgi:hypothetical protein